jgi:thiol-disulfide isomerase/thioredoxin
MFRFVLLVLAAWLSAGAPVAAGEPKAVRPLLRVQDALRESDSYDQSRADSYHKAHRFKMKAGQAYKIEVQSEEFDTYLRLENKDGKEVAFNDDISQRNRNSRILYLAPADGAYRIIVTSSKARATGRYLLTVTPGNKQEAFEARLAGIGGLEHEQQAEVVAELAKFLDGKKADIDAREADLAVDVALTLEYRQAPAAATAYREFGRRLAAAKDVKVAKRAPLLEGAARRLELLGKPLDIKGTLLDGKKIDWPSYRGKVVLVDFWATWCVPCRAEFPNMRRLYAAYRDRGFEIVGISLDSKEEDLTEFLRKEKLPWPTIHERGVDPQPLGDYYGAVTIPQAILVDKEGRVVSLKASGTELERLLAKLIGPLAR